MKKKKKKDTRIKKNNDEDLYRKFIEDAFGDSDVE